MITQVRVKNFKSLRDVDIQLSPLNVFVGPNMSGKSNILDVLRFLHQVFFPESGTQGISFALAQRGGVSEVLWKGSNDKLISIVLEGTDPNEPGSMFKYRLELIAGEGDFVTTQNESLKLIRGGKESDLVVLENGALRLRNSDGKELGGIPPSGASALQYATPGWDGYRFQQWARLWRFYHLLPPVMKQPSLMSLGQVLQPNGENLSAWLMWLQAHSPDSLRRVNQVLHDLFPEVNQVRLIPTPDGRVHLSTREIGLTRPTNVWQTSDGFIAITALLSLLYVPPELSGTVFCIEEPENHLHPRLLETLVALLRQVRQEVVDAHLALTQIMITTQSPFLVDHFSLDEIIWIEKKEGETKAFRPSDKQHLRKLVEDRELGLGDLVYSGALGQDR